MKAGTFLEITMKWQWDDHIDDERAYYIVEMDSMSDTGVVARRFAVLTGNMCSGWFSNGVFPFNQMVTCRYTAVLPKGLKDTRPEIGLNAEKNDTSKKERTTKKASGHPPRRGED